jgi:uncharacterized membrane protein
MLLKIITIARTKKVILIAFIKMKLVFLVIYISLSISIYNFKAYNNYSFKFLSMKINIIIISKLINIIIISKRKIEPFKAINNYKRNNKVIRIIIQDLFKKENYK